MNKKALFCDGTSQYVNPSEPERNEEVVFRFRTAKDDAEHVCLVHEKIRYEMEKAQTGEVFDYYEIKRQLGEEPFRYYFEIQSGSEVCYYNRCGVSERVVSDYDYVVCPGFRTPKWAKGAVMYQIFTDRFCNGDPDNDVEDREYYYIGDYSRKVTDWNRYPATMDVREFYGGDLKGVWDKLDYLQDLGVEVLYFNPIFVSPSNHKYDIQDYDYIDPHYGVIVEDGGNILAEGDHENANATKYQKRVTDKKNLEASNEFFAKLVEEIHKRGMKVIIDGVFNHCGSFNKWLDREHIYSTSPEQYASGAYESFNSPYHTFFKFYSNQWPDNNSYDGWWGNDTLPKLNYEEADTLEQYILGIGKKWVSEPYCVDGWRLDVAADLGNSREYNHQFWKKFRKAVKEANPEAVILAENYGDSYDWLQGDEWDTIMNYDAFMEPVTWFLTGMQKHSDEFRQDMLGNAGNFFGAMHHNMSRMGGQAVAISMNELSNHDHSRFLTRTNHRVGRTASVGAEAANEGINKAVFMEAVIIQMTWPGAPTIYYGDEAGVCGWTDPDNRRTYPWGSEDRELIAFHKAAIAMHKSQEVLKTGSYKPLVGEYNLIAYGRFNQKDAVVVIVNNSEDERRVRVPVWELGITDKDEMEQIFVTFDGGFGEEQLWYTVNGGWLDIGLRKTSAVVLKRVKW